MRHLPAKEAAEVWIGDDENHIPVKIRAKLKIGAAEVYYKDSYNLRAPLYLPYRGAEEMKAFR